MIRLLVFIAVVLLIALVVYLVLTINRAARRDTLLPSDSPRYRNHLGMARWIERQLDEDMGTMRIPEHQRGDARHLLDQFYGDHEIGTDD